MSLLQMSLSGGAFILFITVVRALGLRRLPKGTFLVLWEIHSEQAPWGVRPPGTWAF